MSSVPLQISGDCLPMSHVPAQWLGRSLTHHDLDDLPEDDSVRYEVIDGELYMSPFPAIAHQRVVSRLLLVVGAYLQDHPLGEIFPSGTKVVLDEPTGVGPDLVYIARERLGGLRPDGFYGPPDLVVEVLSTRPHLDRVIKFRKYADAGVPHYWLVDPGDRTLEAYRRSGDGLALDCRLAGDASFTPTLFPGLAIALPDLWA